MMHRAAMFHPSENHCFPDTHHHKCILSHVCFIFFLYMLYLCLNILLGLKALKILSIGNTKVNMALAALQGLSYGWLLGSR